MEDVSNDISFEAIVQYKSDDSAMWVATSYRSSWRAEMGGGDPDAGAGAEEPTPDRAIPRGYRRARDREVRSGGAPMPAPGLRSRRPIERSPGVPARAGPPRSDLAVAPRCRRGI
jgi:hypothetical protein